MAGLRRFWSSRVSRLLALMSGNYRWCVVQQRTFFLRGLLRVPVDLPRELGSPEVPADLEYVDARHLLSQPLEELARREHLHVSRALPASSGGGLPGAGVGVELLE
jgi:hypothetical protein